ncbi:MAG: asparagine synthase (glutamine-hydrolyzing) [Candidatus Omnitrophica bacterium]|nr:asparagine synthase (glutamine-hydrolyzing) [Candidatus Omnitrophota bacterium]
MCGITGFASAKINSPRLRSEILSGMLKSIRHRGPDDEGALLEGDIALAAARLSIIDIAGGRQPIHNENKTVWIAFNGEVYNYPRLREGLIRQGHIFYTHSDTEVIVHLYEEYGYACIEKLEGMFAFCIWDKNRRILFLGRDRFGIKPLYYTRINSEFIFASEIKAILKFPRISREVDLVSLDQYLALEYVPGPRSIFKEIKKLPAANFLIYDCVNQDLTITEYWKMDFTDKYDKKQPQEALAGFLKESIERHLISDVPVGIFLSGGIDSSMLLALARISNLVKIKTFSMGFEEDSFDESRYIRKVSGLFETQHYHYTFGCRDLLDSVLQAGSLLDEPLADASFFPTCLLSKLARREVKAVLSGDGGDEIFAGYPTYQAHKIIKYYNWIPSALSDNLAARFINGLPVSLRNFSFDFKLKKLISYASLPLEFRHLSWMGSFGYRERQDLYLPGLAGYLNQDTCHGMLSSYLEEFKGQDNLDKLQYLDIKTYLQDDILVKADRASMINALEVRLPYLDRQLAEFMFSLPGNLRLRRFKTKYIFKQVAKKFLPSDIVNRSKKGFGVPVGLWIKRGLKEMILEVLAEERIKKDGFFNYKYINKILNQHLDDKADNRKKIWTIFMFQLWFNQYLR